MHRPHTVRLHLNEGLRTGKSIETESGGVSASSGGTRGQGKMKSDANGHGVSLEGVAECSKMTVLMDTHSANTI